LQTLQEKAGKWSNSDDFGDEFHYIFSCSKFDHYRNVPLMQKFRIFKICNL